MGASFEEFIESLAVGVDLQTLPKLIEVVAEGTFYADTTLGVDLVAVGDCSLGLPKYTLSSIIDLISGVAGSAPAVVRVIVLARGAHPLALAVAGEETFRTFDANVPLILIAVGVGCDSWEAGVLEESEAGVA